MLTHLQRLPLALDPLIAEAKRRARQRRGLIAAVLALAVAAAVGVTLAIHSSAGGAGSSSQAPSLGSSRWQPTPAEDPHAHLFDRFNSVTATSAGNAWAVGDYFTGREGGPNGALIEEWTRGRWRQVGRPLPNASGWSVSASSRSDAWALGDHLLEHWDGHNWQETPSAKLPGGGVLHAIATEGAHAAWAVGERWSGGRRIGQTLVERWNGDRWSLVSTPNPPASGHRYDAILQAVSVRSASDAWAVGYWLTGPHMLASRTLIEHWNGRQWRLVPSPSVRTSNGVRNNILFAVSADRSNDAWAVGSYGSRAQGYGGGGDHALVLHWNGQRWSRSALPRIRQRSLLSGVAANGGRAWAVGDRGEQPRQRPLIERWNETRWTIAPSPSGFDLAAVSAPTGGRAWVVGAVGHRPLAATLVRKRR